MEVSLMSTHVRELQEFYLEAALQTYAGKGKKTTILDLPGAKVYTWEKGDLRYLDSYYTNHEHSGGQTIISENEKPVWLMQYHGWCQSDDPEVLEFLKRALTAAYSQQIFFGGRGPQEYREVDELDLSTKANLTESPHPLIYQNARHPSHTSFADFRGREYIFRWPYHTDHIFWHEYTGMLMRPVTPEEE